MINDREIANYAFSHSVTLTFDLRIPKYTADLQLIIFLLAKYEKHLMKNDREIAERSWRERRKKKNVMPIFKC